MPDPQILASVYAAADKYHIPRDLFASLIQAESNFNPSALSPKGAQGLGQLMPGTAQGLGVRDSSNPQQNLEGSAHYFSGLLKQFNDESLALAAYNAGPGAVMKYGGIPPYPETVNYVGRIQANRIHYGTARMAPTAAPDLAASFRSPALAQSRDLAASFRSAPVRAAKASAPPRDLAASFRTQAQPVAAAGGPDLAASFRSQPTAAPAAPPLPQLGTPGNPRRSGAAPPPDVAALSYPRHVTTGGNAPLQTTPAMMAQERAQPGQQASKANVGLAAGTLAHGLQKPLNTIWTPGTLGSAYFNNVVREVAKQHAAGKPEAWLAPYMADIPAYIEAARRTPWSKLLVQGAIGNYAEFPEPLHAVKEGAPQSVVGQWVQKHPVAATAIDLAVSFPITAAFGEAQNMVVGKIGQGLQAANRATGAGEQILNRLPLVRNFLQNQDIHGAATELINKGHAGMQQYLDDVARDTEDIRATSQKLQGNGMTLGYKSPKTGQPVNLFDEFVGDRVNIGQPGNPYESPHPSPEQIARDSALAERMHGILTRARGALAEGPEGLAWSQAARDIRGELATPYTIPAETGAGKTLSGVLGRARETGPGVIRAQAYNDLGEAAQRGAREANTAAQLERLHADIRAHGIDPADVDRIAAGFARTFDNLGKHLVDTGLVDAGAWEQLKGHYLPRLYLMTKGDPGDINKFLEFLNSEGALTPEAALEAQKRGLTKQWGKEGMYGRSGVGPRSFDQHRELLTYEERNDLENARAVVPEASVAALHGVQAQARAAGLARGMEEIAKNPEWAKPLEEVTAEELKRGWKPYAGKGPLSGLAIHPGIQMALKAQTNPNMLRDLLVRFLGDKAGNFVYQGNQLVRKGMLAGPSTMENVGVGHYWFTAAGAEDAGTHFTPVDYALAGKDMRAAKRGERYDPYLLEAQHKTDLLTAGSSVLPQEAKRVSGGFGLEGRSGNAKRIAEGMLKKYLNTTHDVLAVGKFGLYRQLRRSGKSIDEAARLTRQATINYTALPPWVRAVDQGMIIPFFTFTYRAVPLAGKMALRHPDIFASASGHRFTYFLDRMADRLAESRGKQPEAVAARQSGLIGPTTFAIPGATEHGKQRYARAPLLAPLLHHWVPGQDIEGMLTHPFLGALRQGHPVVGALASVALNRDLRNEDLPRLLPGYLPPGFSTEKTGVVGSYLLHALMPPVGKLELFKRALEGTTPYPRAGLRPQTLGEAALGYLTGTRLGTAQGLKPSAEISEENQKAIAEGRRPETLAIEKQAEGVKYGLFARNYFLHLMGQHSANLDYTPNPALRQKAKELTPTQFDEALKSVQQSLQAVVYGEHYTKGDRMAAIRRLMDWTYELGVSAQKRGMRSTPVFRGLGMGIGRPLARLGGS